MERWDEARFAAVGARLESLPDSSLWAPEDYYLLVEWTAQRYLPRDTPFTEREWATARQRLNKKVDTALAELRKGGDLGASDRQQRESERQRLAKLFREPLPLTELQLRTVVLPLLAQFDFGPPAGQWPEEEVRRLTLACRNPYVEGISLADRQAIRDAQDTFRGEFHPAVLETLQSLASNYELLLRARRSGYLEVKIVVPQGCACMVVAFDGKSARVDRLIEAFEQGDTSYPVLPSPRAACGAAEDPRICRANLIVLPRDEEQAPGHDPDFQLYLKKVLDERRQELDADWPSRINANL